MSEIFRLAVAQMQVDDNKTANLDKAARMVQEACIQGVEMIVLPEIFNSPYKANLFPQYAELYGDTTTRHLSELALENNVIIVGGSIPERGENGRIFNTSFVFGKNGKLLGRHRKIHLFDIDIPGQISFRESHTLSAGQDLTILRHDNLCFSVLICYDVRFPELARLASLAGAQILVIPAAFNRTTGPLHWELLMRSRALDNQVFVVAASPSLNEQASYKAWGHSMVVDPWGKIISLAGDGEELLVVDLDLTLVNQVRSQIPVLKQRRDDLYNLEWRNNDY